MIAMVATTSQRMMVSPTSRSMVNPPTDPTRAARRTPERCGKSRVLQTQNCGLFRSEHFIGVSVSCRAAAKRLLLAAALQRALDGRQGLWGVDERDRTQGEAVCQKAGET